MQKFLDRDQLHDILADLGEGILLVEPPEGIVWANEQALALHGVGELADLGTSTADYYQRFRLKYRNNHLLTEERYPMNRLLRGDVFQEVTVEVSKKTTGSEMDEWSSIHQLRGIILSDSAGVPEFHALIIEDMTERFMAEERFERTFAANPAPAIICRLADLRYIKVNQGFLDMTGYDHDRIIGRSAYEFDVLDNVSDKETMIAALREGSTIPQTEATLRLPHGARKPAIVAGQPIEVGEEECMLFTFVDMEPRQKAENALRQSEERFARSFRLAPVPTLLVARDGFHLLDVNDAFVSALGFGAEEIVNKSGAALPIWESSASRRQFEREMEQNGSVRDLEMKFRTKHDEILDCLVSVETVSINEEECALMVIQDITERKRSEFELIAALEAVMKDTSWFSRAVIEKLAKLRQSGGSNGPGVELSDLTPRELELLGLMSQGLSDAEIVKLVGLTRNTVRNHVARIYSKIDVHTRAAAVVWARERGVIGAATGTRSGKSRKNN